MTLRNELYIIENTTESGGYKIRMNSDSLIYRAHFPGEPITPGVCIIQIVTELLEEKLCIRLALSEVTNAKFLAVIDPRHTESILISFTKILESDNCLKINATVSDSQITYTKLSLVYKKI